VTDTVTGSTAILANYGVTPRDWPVLRQLAYRRGNLLSEDVASYLNNLFHHYDEESSKSALESKDQVWWAQHVPLREYGEEEGFHQTYNRPNIEQVEQLVRDTSATGLVALYWKATARHTVERELDWDGDLSVNTDVIEERLHSLYQNTHGYKETYEHLKDEVQTLSRTMIVSPGGVDHSWREGVVSEAVMPSEKTDPTISSDGSDLPQSWEARDDAFMVHLVTRGIDLFNPEDFDKLTDTDFDHLREQFLRKRRFDIRESCWYPIEVDERLQEITQELSQIRKNI
jgi:hypothetical protein